MKFDQVVTAILLPGGPGYSESTHHLPALLTNISSITDGTQIGASPALARLIWERAELSLTNRSIGALFTMAGRKSASSLFLFVSRMGAYYH